MTARRVLLGCLGLVLVGAAIGAYVAVWPAIPAVQAAGSESYGNAEVARGAALAAIGDCAVCHTGGDGATLAGGRPIPTPFGTVYATNITPDAATGIGRWSETAFRRAMRDGIARDGSHLYPVLPYPHFTRASDADIRALYAYLMTRQPVARRAPENRLPFPLNQRVVLAGWDLLFLRPGPLLEDPEHDATWNRGRYLAEAVGHCGACHTPHNPLGAETTTSRFAGGVAEGWPAPALQDDSPAPRPWTVAALETYLAGGFQPDHGAAAGPMTAVTAQLSHAPAADVHAIAVYFASLMPHDLPPGVAPAASPERQGADPETAALFTGACGSCHGAAAPMVQAGAPSLALSSAVHARAPDGVIAAILQGLPWRDGQAAAYMPAFGPALTDAQVAALAGYIRATYTHEPGWTGLPAAVAKVRKEQAS